MSRVLVIAGTDSSGGAGLARDMMVATQLGCEVKPVVTAVTVQTDQEMRHITPVSPEVVAGQIIAGFEGEAPRAVKIGMLATPEIAAAVAATLRSYDAPIVIDTVLRSSSGGQLFDGDGFGPLFRLAALITPNLDEAAALTHRPLAGDDGELTTQAQMLQGMGSRAVLLKGGHGTGAESVDHLFQGADHRRFAAPRLVVGKRGTGCALSSAIACGLALGHDLPTACEYAKRFVHGWMARG